MRRTANTYSFLLLNDKIICVCRIRSGCEPVANHVFAVFPFGPRRVGVEFDSWHRKRDYFFRFPIRPSPRPRPQPSSPLPNDDGRRGEGETDNRAVKIYGSFVAHSLRPTDREVAVAAPIKDLSRPPSCTHSLALGLTKPLLR